MIKNRRLAVGIALALILLALTVAHCDTIALWDYNEGPGVLSPITGAGSQSLAPGTQPYSGSEPSLSPVDSSDPNTAGEAYGIKAVHAAGRGIQWSVPTVGYYGIAVEWDWRRSGTTTPTWELDCSTDGITWTAVQTLNVPDTNWQDNNLVNLPEAADNNPGLMFRLITGTAAGTASSTMRFDMVEVKGTSQQDPNPPAVTIDQALGQADPAIGQPINFAVAFSKPVTGFDAGKVLVTGTAGGAKTVSVSGSGSAYTVSISGLVNSGTIMASIPAGAAQDARGHPSLASESTDNTVTYVVDSSSPSVTINQAADQPDPASSQPIRFAVVFGKIVTDFGPSSVTVSGTAGGDKTVVVSGSGITYEVAVSGFSSPGTVMARIMEGAAHDSAGNPNTASTSVDNVVTFNFSASSATPLRIASWNVTNYSGLDGREAAFQTAIYGIYEGRSMAPDAMMGQEFGSQAGVDSFKQLLNSAPGSPGDWEAAPFVNGPDTDSAFFYRLSRCTLLGYTVVFQATGSTNQPPRNSLRYDISPKGYSPGGAPCLALYSSHMKSGTGDGARRLQEAQYIRDNAETLPSSWSFVFGGDTNIQSSNEAAYQELVALQSVNIGRFFDPIDSPGTWYSNSGFRFIHTQDPTGSGGMDDRHDQLLLSHSLVDGVGFDYVGNPSIPYSTTTWNDPNHSYRAWGNDGTSFNLSLTTTGNTMVGPDIAQALITTAAGGGHLPVFLDLRLPAEMDAQPGTIDFGNITVNGSATMPVTVWNGANASLWGAGGIATLNYWMTTSSEFSAPTGPFSSQAGDVGNTHFISVDTSSSGHKTGALTLVSSDPSVPSRVIPLTADVISAPVASRISKSDADETPTNVTGIITAVYPDFLYIENADRSNGIRVEKTSHGLTRGTATVTGVLRTNAAGERYIAASSAQSGGTDSVAPLGIGGGALGGGATPDYNPAAHTGQAGARNRRGANNVGLLVRTWGRIVEMEQVIAPATPTWFKLDDGSGGKIMCRMSSGAALDSNSTLVGVTGVCSLESTGDPVILVQAQSDIELL